MQLLQLLKHFGLNPQQLEKLLSKNGIEANLKFIRHVPEEWISVLTRETSILLPNTAVSGDKKISFATVEEVEKKEVGIAVLPVHEITPKLDSSETDVIPHEDILETTQLQNINNQQQETKVEKEYFWAYVKFISSNNSHGYVKRVNNPNEISSHQLFVKDGQDYKIQCGKHSLQKGQLIVCSNKDPNVKQAKVQTGNFYGIIKRDYKESKVFDLSSLLSPFRFDVLQKDLSYPGPDIVVCYNLILSRGSLQLIEIKQKERVKLNSHLASKYYKKVILNRVHFDDVKELLPGLEFYIENKKELFQLQQQTFERELKEICLSKDNIELIQFLDKWCSICPEIVTLQNLNLPIEDSFFIERWLNNSLPTNFWGDKLVDAYLNYLSGSSFEENQNAFSKLKRILTGQHETTYNQVLSAYLSNIELIKSEAAFLILKKVALTAIGNAAGEFISELTKKVSPEIKLDLWLKNEVFELPQKEALQLFGTLQAKDQDKVVQHLKESDLWPILDFVTLANDSSTLERCFHLIKADVLERFSAISLDIESDGEQIYELAWGRFDNWYVGLNAEQITEMKNLLMEKIAVTESIFIGHNIIDFDSCILSEHGVQLPDKNIWDTLLVEMAINPNLKYYALKTSHHARQDAELTLKFFITQVLRLIKLDEESWSMLLYMFSEKIRSILSEIRSEYSFSWINSQKLYEEMLSYLRPQPKEPYLISELNNKLAASDATSKVILASTEFWEELCAISGIYFCCSNNTDKDFQEMDEEIFINSLNEGTYEWVLANRFFNYCQAKGIPALSANIPPAIRIKLSSQGDIVSSLKKVNEPEWEKEQLICLDTSDLCKYQTQLIKQESAEIYVVEPGLISLTTKRLLAELELHTMIDSLNTDHLWIKFSGGQSFIELDKEQVKSLNVEVPEGYTNLWIEKYLFGKYRIWGNTSWETFISSIPSGRIHILERSEEKFPKSQVYYSICDNKKLHNTLEVVRFNPETIYRSRYWLLQKQLIQSIINKSNREKPVILLVQRSDEIATLEQYFSQMGFYIPDGNISLGRRLELLHQSKRSLKVLICSSSQASKIVSANYLGPLNVILDSFNLYEKYYLTKGSSLFEKLRTTSNEVVADSNEDSNDSSEDVTRDFHGQEIAGFLQKDIFFLLKLHVPLINRLRSLLWDDHEENKLWLLDPRIEDFTTLGEVWNATRTVLQTWDTKQKYQEDVEIADKIILSPRPLDKMPFSIEETKEILQKVFLPEKASWYPVQHQYLDKILPAQSNILVALPTGGGKSLLFQGPALYRSSFTNRLTIVVTPLKALMEDQVKALWKLGFYGSVEYINQDKSHEIQHIYRRLAGGELSLLYITPERFRSGGFIRAFLQRLQNDGGLEYAVYDEAHCISQWGHEFRPDYLYSGRAVQRFKDTCQYKFPILFFSATVSEKIYRDFNSIFK